MCFWSIATCVLSDAYTACYLLKVIIYVMFSILGILMNIFYYLCYRVPGQVALPSGNYSGSCAGCYWQSSSTVLACTCADGQGATELSYLNVQNCAGVVNNYNGILGCTGTQSSNFWLAHQYSYISDCYIKESFKTEV